MAEVLLTSEEFIKEVSNISDNISGKFLLPSMREAQDIKFKAIVGDALLEKLKGLVKARQINDPTNIWYKRLIDEAQYYLAYSTIVELTYKVSYKVSNIGMAKTNDENVQVVTKEEMDNQRFYYQAKADAYCYQLQGWILENKQNFPELTENHCRKIHATLMSAASCGLFLGGARGKRIRR